MTQLFVSKQSEMKYENKMKQWMMNKANHDFNHLNAFDWMQLDGFSTTAPASYYRLRNK